MDDLALVLGARGVLPEVISVVLRPRGNVRLTGQQQVDSRLGLSQLSFRWRVVEMWNLAAEDLLAANDVGIIPWVPLTRHAGPPEVLIQQCRDRIDQQARPEEHANLLAVTQVMTRLAYNNPDLLKILGGSRAMIKSPLMQEFEAEIEAKVEAKVESQTMHEDILQNLETLFGAVPPEIGVAVRQILDRSRLRELHRFAIVCPDLDAFRTKISPGTV